VSSLNRDTIGGKLVVLDYTKDASSEVRVFDAMEKMKSSAVAVHLGAPIRSLAGGNAGTFHSFALTTRRRHLPFRPGKLAELWAQNRVPLTVHNLQLNILVRIERQTAYRVFVSQERHETDPSTPVLLTGYGGFDSSETPSTLRFYLTGQKRRNARRAKFAGGGEILRSVARAGMLEKKQGTCCGRLEYARSG